MPATPRPTSVLSRTPFVRHPTRVPTRVANHPSDAFTQPLRPARPTSMESQTSTATHHLLPSVLATPIALTTPAIAMAPAISGLDNACTTRLMLALLLQIPALGRNVSIRAESRSVFKRQTPATAIT